MSILAALLESICPPDPEASPSDPDLACLQCGHCCGPYFSLYVSETDEERWEAEGGRDLLDRLEHERDRTLWDETGAYDRVTGERLEVCVFLVESPNGRRQCGIHARKPEICREFPPGSSELCVLFPKKRIIRGILK